MSASKQPNHTRIPWRSDAPDREGMVRVHDKNGRELLVCEATIAAVIVKAVNWCGSRGYLS